MKITEKRAQNLLEVLEEVKEQCLSEHDSSYPYAQWEQKRKKVKQRLQNLPSYIDQAAQHICYGKPRVGQPKKLTVQKRTMLFLFTRMMNKSNRDMEDLLVLFKPLFGITVSYKSIERLYSDYEVNAVLHNLFILLLEDEGVSGDLSGDGTGYSLTITRHYRTDVSKKGKNYLYVFRIIDIDTGFYVAVGYSNSSEMQAFQRAMTMLKEIDISVDSMSLDKYYSSRKVLKLFGENTMLYLIPKKNLVRIGFEWSRILRNILKDPYLFLKGYFLRCLSESGFSADKRRFGGLVRQKREDRREMALFSIAFLHNIFISRVRPG